MGDGNLFLNRQPKLSETVTGLGLSLTSILKRKTRQTNAVYFNTFCFFGSGSRSLQQMGLAILTPLWRASPLQHDRCAVGWCFSLTDPGAGETCSRPLSLAPRRAEASAFPGDTGHWSITWVPAFLFLAHIPHPLQILAGKECCVYSTEVTRGLWLDS